jgi:hypothetical protein
VSGRMDKIYIWWSERILVNSTVDASVNTMRVFQFCLCLLYELEYQKSLLPIETAVSTKLGENGRLQTTCASKVGNTRFFCLPVVPYSFGYMIIRI